MKLRGEMSSAPSPYVMLACILLLPAVPAYLLFRLLPSTANVSGPLQGLEIKLGGAFAGYFALVILIFAQQSKWNPPPAYQVWELNGQLSDNTGAGIELLTPDDVKLSPPNLELKGGGNFRAEFVTAPPLAGGAIDFPTITLGHKGFRSVTITLRPLWDHQKITLKPIALGNLSLPAYTGQGQTLNAVPAPAPAQGP